ncbi:hypothetical protein BFR69_09630 [Acinetobacter pittii]|uniref:Uncharacterized protein n=1 Tax=Acinetobacter baumannii TaxID=470 RepID=A0A854NAZ3_ACIBA|nr:MULTISPECIES: hypothetical protein [Acinetobacter]AVN22524.1 hypothetical protein C6N17_12630 [Acinetobacter pittii]EMD5935391.1 hypothetical protein [Acinetobacter baumannii]KQD33021.1 hypothetical protein APD13_04400 [Acinetobacter pittii]KQD50040.1 hypothetical protein APD12_04235 [Acinetobacter pittii]KQF48873.1 hypothetical protein APC13_21215 [Acinetobacter pittii]
MFNEDEEKLAHENWYKNNDPIAYKFYRDLSPEFETDFYTSETAWLARAKAQAVRPQKYFSHDFNGDGFKYHDSLNEAQKEAEASLDWYRDKVADGHHVAEDGEFYELCYGVVIASAGYTVDEVVTEEHHKKDEFTKYEVGTEILRLHFNKCNSESGAEG